MEKEIKFKVGDRVYKTSGDYKFVGEVRSVFTKKNGIVRFVVEDDIYGMLHIYNESNLEHEL